MAISGVAFTMYPVSDLPRSVAFYRDVLGLPKAGIDSDFWVEFEVGGGTFGIGNFEQCGKPGTAQSLALEVSNLGELRKSLAAAGVETTQPYETQVCFISTVRDPDGNQVYLHEAKPQ